MPPLTPKRKKANKAGAAGEVHRPIGQTVEPAAPATAKTDGVFVPSTPRDLMLSYQRTWADDAARFKIGMMARQTGKDFSSGEEGIRDCYLHEIGKSKVDWLIVAPSERQAIESLNKWKQWSEAYGLDIADISEHTIDNTPDLRATIIEFPAGSRVIAVPGRPDTVRGFSANILGTEFAFLEDPDATWRAWYPSISNKLRGGEKKIRLISTPNGRGNKFEELWTKNYGKTDADVAKQVEAIIPPEIRAKIEAAIAAAPQRAGSRLTIGEARMRWSCHRVDIYDAVRGGLPVNIAELYAGMNDPEGWAQEFELVFLDSASVLLGYDVIAMCEAPEATETVPFEYWLAKGGNPVDLGIDFGRKRDLTVCWAAETVGAMGITKEVLCLEGMSTPDQIDALRPRIAKARRVAFDYTGPGIGMGDFLVKEFGEWKPSQNLFGKIQLITFTQAEKVRLYSALPVRMQRGEIKIPRARSIREDFHSVYRVVTPSGNVTYRAPHSTDGHADRLNAFALWNEAAAPGTLQVFAIVC